jgi:hypothetical protein
MGGVSILGSTQPIRDALNRVEDIGRDPSSVLRALGAGVVRHTKWRIDEGIDPRGVRWESYAPLNPIYASTPVFCWGLEAQLVAYMPPSRKKSKATN